MDAKLVAYDLHDADAFNYEILIDELDSLGAAHLQESVWSVNFDGVCTELAERLAPYLNAEDRLHIVSYNNPEFFSFNNLDENQFKETVNQNTIGIDFKWGSKLTRK